MYYICTNPNCEDYKNNKTTDRSHSCGKCGAPTRPTKANEQEMER